MCNPGMVPADFVKWQEYVMQQMPVAPAYFGKMKEMNVSGKWAVSLDLPEILSLEEVVQKQASSVIVDLHHPEAFATGHIKGTINLPFTPHFSLWAGMVLPQDKDIILVVSSMAEAIQAIQLLRIIGIDHVVGVSDSTRWEPKDSSYLESSPILEPSELHERLDEFYLIDTRPPSEWRTGYIPGSHRIELTAIMHGMDRLPKDKPIALVCRSGNRSSSAASILRNAGFTSATNIKGGMQGWVQSKLPVSIP